MRSSKRKAPKGTPQAGGFVTAIGSCKLVTSERGPTLMVIHDPTPLEKWMVDFWNDLRSHGWKQDNPAHQTVFAMGTIGEKRMTRLEASLVISLEDEIHNLFAVAVKRAKPKIPDNIPHDLWNQACDGDAKSIREVNRTSPGSIYYYAAVADHISRHTVLATLHPDPEVSFKSRDWLKTALLPFVSYSGKNEKKGTPRSEIARSHLKTYWLTLKDIFVIRGVAKNVRQRNTQFQATELARLFPELTLLEGETCYKVPRLNWERMINGKKAKNGSPKYNVADTDAAMQIIADITGYEYRHIYDRLRHLNGTPLIDTTKKIREEAHGLARSYTGR